MKKFRWALLGLSLLYVPALQAEDTGKADDRKAGADRRDGRGNTRFQRGGEGRGGSGLQPGRIGASLPAEKDLETLKLTAEQKEKVAKIYKDHETRQKELARQFEGLRGGERPDRAKFRELFEARIKAHEDAENAIKALLSDEQKKQFDGLRRSGFGGRGGAGGFGRGGFGPGGFGRFTPGQVLPEPVKNRLDLTEDQRKQIDALEKDLKTKLDKILTEEQKKKLEQGPGRPDGDSSGRPRRPGGASSDRPRRPPSN